VRVLGQLKSFNNKKHVGSHHIRLVTDFNEVMYHLLEAASIHLHLTRGPPEQFAPTGDGMAGNVGYNIPHGGGDVAMGGMHGGVVGGRGVGGGAAGGGGAYPPNSSHNARVVYETIKAASESNEGVHYKVIQMRSNLPIDAVTKGIEELVARGAAYTTLDENHVATMDF
jgi:replication factor A2